MDIEYGVVGATHAQALALEDDTAHVLSARSDVITDTNEHPVRLMTALYDDVPLAPGAVVVKGRNPFILLAMIHDFDREPSFREVWLRGALQEVIKACEARQVRHLATEPLGCRHAKLELSRFTDLLESAVDAAQPSYLRTISVLA